MIRELIGIALTNAVTATLLGALVAVTSRWIRRPAVTHALWIVVLCDLLAPPVLRIAVMPSSDTGLIAMTIARLTAAPEPLPLTLDPSRGEGSLSAWPLSVTAKGRGPEPPSVSSREGGMATKSVAFIASEAQRFGLPVASETPGVRQVLPSPPPTRGVGKTGISEGRGRFDAVHVIAVIWLAGTLVVLFLAFLRAARFSRRIRGSPEAEPALGERVSSLAALLGMRRRLGLRLVSARISPVLWFRRGSPVVLFPERLLAELGEGERDALLLHELAHIKRCDHWVRFLELAATAAFWWHPLVYWARREMRRAEEQSCDAWVLRCRPGGAGEYAQGLIKTVEFLAGARLRSPALASGLGAYRLMEERLIMIVKESTPKRLSWLQGATLAVIAGAVLLAFPTRVARSSTPQAANARRARTATADANEAHALGAHASTASVPRAAMDERSPSSWSSERSSGRGGHPGTLGTLMAAQIPGAAAAMTAAHAESTASSRGGGGSSGSSVSEADSEAEEPSTGPAPGQSETATTEADLAEVRAAAARLERELQRIQREIEKARTLGRKRAEGRLRAIETERTEAERQLKALAEARERAGASGEASGPGEATELERAMKELAEAEALGRGQKADELYKLYKKSLEESRKQLGEHGRDAQALDELRRLREIENSKHLQDSGEPEHEIGSQIQRMREALAQLTQATDRLKAEQRQLREGIETLERELQHLRTKKGS